MIKLRAMGDTVLTTSALAALRETLPGAEIHGLFPEVWAPLIENHPACDRIWRWPKPQGLGKLLQTWSFAAQLRKARYDAVIALHAASTTAWLARLSGAPVRSVHFHGIHDDNRFSTVEIAGKGRIQPILERDMDALRALGLEIVKPPKPKIHLTAAEKDAAQTWLRERDAKGPVMSLGLGASRPTKQWPPAKFLELSEAWNRRTRGSVLLILGPGEKPLAEPFFMKPYAMVRTSGDLRETAALLGACDLFVGNDSGPKHLAAAVGTPTITLFGPENPFEWHPYDRDEHRLVFHEGLSCRKALAPGLPEWCGIPACEVERHRCMREIHVEEVIKLWPRQFQNS